MQLCLLQKHRQSFFDRVRGSLQKYNHWLIRQNAVGFLCELGSNELARF